MTPKDIFVPASITQLKTIDPEEIRVVELSLPEDCQIDGKPYPIKDKMWPGTAFLSKPFGSRTQKFRRRMYTRSNFPSNHPGVLETVVNHTHAEKADTSIWWQTPEAQAYQSSGNKIDVLVRFNPETFECEIFENALHCDPHNLRLEADGEWQTMKYLAIALSTGITPFLSYLRYMKEMNFGKSNSKTGAHLTLIASAKRFEQLIAHEELLCLEKDYKQNFRYHPVLTRKWPEDWKFTKGRVVKAQQGIDGHEQYDIEPMKRIIPDLKNYHLRFCGGKIARDHIEQGLKQAGESPLSFRAEVW
ncbi:MAG TPA: hypothetical protein VGB26_01605 [Nitrospiria bacterium]|jgi:hypothetical protein